MKIACVLLAAGEGSRLGGVPKALIKLNGKLLIHHQIEALQSVGAQELVVVTGHYSERVETAIQSFQGSLPIRIVRNKNLQNNQASSVRLGIETLGAQFDLILMMLSDQPLIGEQDLREIISVHLKHPDASIILPIVKGSRGNPVAFSGSVMQQILNIDGMGCRAYMDQQPEKVLAYETLNQHFITDIDDIKDLDTINQVWNICCELP